MKTPGLLQVRRRCRCTRNCFGVREQLDGRAVSRYAQCDLRG